MSISYDQFQIFPTYGVKFIKKCQQKTQKLLTFFPKVTHNNTKNVNNVEFPRQNGQLFT